MTTCQDMLDDLDDRLGAVSAAAITEARKIVALNHGIRAMWPRLYRVVRDDSLLLVDDQVEYELPVAISPVAQILRVDMETEQASGLFYRLTDYEVVRAAEVPLLDVGDCGVTSEAGSKLRVTVAQPITAFAASTDTYDGPAGTEELPVWYAQGVIFGRRLEPRADHRRYPSVTGQNGVETDDIMAMSQFAFAQFELLLDRFAMPLPGQIDR